MPIAESDNNEVLAKDNDTRDNVLDNNVFTNQSPNNENQNVECEVSIKIVI
jgi:hypothetical protein